MRLCVYCMSKFPLLFKRQIKAIAPGLLYPRLDYQGGE